MSGRCLEDIPCFFQMYNILMCMIKDIINRLQAGPRSQFGLSIDERTCVEIAKSILIDAEGTPADRTKLLKALIDFEIAFAIMSL